MGCVQWLRGQRVVLLRVGLASLQCGGLLLSLMESQLVAIQDGGAVDVVQGKTAFLVVPSLLVVIRIHGGTGQEGGEVERVGVAGGCRSVACEYILR